MVPGVNQINFQIPLPQCHINTITSGKMCHMVGHSLYNINELKYDHDIWHNGAIHTKDNNGAT